MGKYSVLIVMMHEFITVHWNEGLNLIRSVQSVSCVRLLRTPGIAACQASLSITNSRSLLKHISIMLIKNRIVPRVCFPGKNQYFTSKALYPMTVTQLILGKDEVSIIYVSALNLESVYVLSHQAIRIRRLPSWLEFITEVGILCSILRSTV